MRRFSFLLALFPAVALAQPASSPPDPLQADDTIAQQDVTIGQLYQAMGTLSHQIVQLKRDLAAAKAASATSSIEPKPEEKKP